MTVWLRGKAILDAVINDLLTVRGMRTASNVVVGGCSAGGMAVYLHCDHWAGKIRDANAEADVVCLADAGWFPLIESTYDGVALPSTWFNGVWQSGYTNHNASGSMHPKCLADHAATPTAHTTTMAGTVGDTGVDYSTPNTVGDTVGGGTAEASAASSSVATNSAAWLCTMPQVAARYVETPLFAYNARYDAFQIPNMMQDCFGNATDKFGGKDCTSEVGERQRDEIEID